MSTRALPYEVRVGRSDWTKRVKNKDRRLERGKVLQAPFTLEKARSSRAILLLPSDAILLFPKSSHVAAKSLTDGRVLRPSAPSVKSHPFISHASKAQINITLSRRKQRECRSATCRTLTSSHHLNRSLASRHIHRVHRRRISLRGSTKFASATRHPPHLVTQADNSTTSLYLPHRSWSSNSKDSVSSDSSAETVCLYRAFGVSRPLIRPRRSPRRL